MLRFTVALVAFAALCSSVRAANTSETVVMCYYGTWANYRTGNGGFTIDNVNRYGCTHLVYAFVGLNNNGSVELLDPWTDVADGGGKDYLNKFNALKKENSALKTILAIGGWNEGSAKYSTMAASAELRAIFVKSAVEILLKYGFDGFDLDWEYPARRDSTNGQADVDNYSKLCAELRAAFDKQTPRLSLSAAVSSVKSAASLSYNVSAIAKSLDLIAVMTYDMTVATENKTGYNSPLYKGIGDEDVPDEDALTVDAAIKYWISQGAPPEKLLVGIPFYGHSFLLEDANSNTARSPNKGPGLAGNYTQENGTLAYHEFCTLVQEWGNFTIVRDEAAQVPYAYSGVNWVSYDDAESVAAKTKYAINKGLGGVMVWSIESDDFHGLCHGQTYYLLRAINNVLNRSVDGPSTTTTA